MTIHALVTLSNTEATRLTPNGLHSGMDITIQNVHGSAIVYLGGEDVSSADYGYKLTTGNAWSVELSGYDALYAISSVDNSQVAVLKTALESGN